MDVKRRRGRNNRPIDGIVEVPAFAVEMSIMDVKQRWAHHRPNDVPPVAGNEVEESSSPERVGAMASARTTWGCSPTSDQRKRSCLFRGYLSAGGKYSQWRCQPPTVRLGAESVPGIIRERSSVNGPQFSVREPLSKLEIGEQEDETILAPFEAMAVQEVVEGVIYVPKTKPASNQTQWKTISAIVWFVVTVIVVGSVSLSLKLGFQDAKQTSPAIEDDRSIAPSAVSTLSVPSVIPSVQLLPVSSPAELEELIDTYVWEMTQNNVRICPPSLLGKHPS